MYLSDPDRIAAVFDLGILHSPGGESLDQITRIAARMLDTQSAAVTLLTGDRQYLKSTFGLHPELVASGHTPVETSFCQHVVNAAAPFLVDDATAHPLLKDSPMATKYRWRSYLGVPLQSPDGHVLGALCVAGDTPRRWTPIQVELLTELARITLKELNRQVARETLEAVGFGAETVPMFIVDVESARYVAVNDAALAQYGYSREEFLNLRVEDLRPASEVARLSAAMNARSGYMENHGVWVHRRRDGTLLDVEIITRDITYHGRRARAVIASSRSSARQQEESSRICERHFKSLVENTTDIISIIDASGEVRYVNPAIERVLGYSAAETTGLDVLELLHPDDRTAVQSGLQSGALRCGESMSYRHRCLRRDGSWRLLESQGRSLFPNSASGGIVVTSRDITDLRAAQERLAYVSATSPAVLYTLVPGSTETWVSDNIRAILGYTVVEASSRNWWKDNLHPDDRAAALAAFRNLLDEGGVLSHEYRFRAKDGSFRWIRDQINLIRGVDGTPVEIVGSWMDATDMHELQEQLLQSQKMEAVGQLAGGIAHDFNNILTAISGYADLILNEIPALDPLRNDVEEVRKGAARASALTRQLLAFSRKQILCPEVLDLCAAVSDMRGMLRRVIREDIVLTMAAGRQQLWTRVDRSQLQQVVLNLVVNASDAMTAGGQLTISMGSRTVLRPEFSRAGHVPAGRYVTLSVSDTGAGIPAHVMPRIFEPFFTTKAPGKGTGLGLSTVYGIITQSGGRLSVTSKPGEGTTFEILLPVAETAADAGPLSDETLPDSGDETIMVVEDESGVRSLICRILRKHGYKVIETETPAHAVDMIRAQPFPDLVLTDMVMPGMNGVELASKVRALCPDTKVLMMSGYSENELSVDGLVHEAAFLQKPFDSASLLAAIRSCLSATQPARRS